jgi:hypothetical protein
MKQWGGGGEEERYAPMPSRNAAIWAPGKFWEGTLPLQFQLEAHVSLMQQFWWGLTVTLKCFYLMENMKGVSKSFRTESITK